MRGATREAFEQALLAFVAGSLLSRRRGAGRPAAIDRSTPLFETGLVDSLGIVDLIAFVEDATGRPVPIRMVDLKHFGSIARISRSFWPAEEAA